MLAYLFLALAVAVRFMPHPWMFTPVTGSLLFFGANGSRRRLWIPVVALAASDLALTKFYYHYPFTADILVTFAWYAAIVWLGTKLGRNPKMWSVIGAALAGSVSFYLITNFVAWTTLHNLYPRDFSGLMMSYAAGLPFFRHALEGDLFFTMVMFATPLALRALRGASAESDHTAAA